MLFVLFHLGNDRYALEARHIVEVVPLLALKKIPQSPKGISGIFVYRGRPVPALDLCELTFSRPASERLSTRIIIINCAEKNQPEQLVGVIAEHATETMRREPKDFVDAGLNLAAAPFLGPVLLDDKGVIQLLHAQKLLAEKLRESLFTPTLEVSNDSH